MAITIKGSGITSAELAKGTIMDEDISSQAEITVSKIHYATPTGSDIKTAYEKEPNAFTDDQFTKLGELSLSDIVDNKNDIVELAEEIEFLAPSVDRGYWEYDEETDAPRPPASKGYYLTNAISARVDTYAQADIILFNNTDSNGGAHTFSDVSEGDWLEVFESGDADFLLATVTGVNLSEGYSSFDIQVIKAAGAPTVAAQGGEGVRIKFFTLSEAEINLDSYAQTAYVDSQDAKKLNLTGGTVTGALDIKGPNKASGTNFIVKDSNGYPSFEVKGAKGDVFVDAKLVATQPWTQGILSKVATSGSYNDLSNKPASLVEIGTSSGPPNGKAKGTLYLTTTGKLYIYTS